MAWEISLHAEVERWHLELCRDDPQTADGIADDRFDEHLIALKERQQADPDHRTDA